MNSNYIPQGYLVDCICEGYLPLGFLWRLIKEFEVFIQRVFDLEVEQ